MKPYGIITCGILYVVDHGVVAIILPGRIEGKGSGESPFALIPFSQLRCLYKQNITVRSICESNIGINLLWPENCMIVYCSLTKRQAISEDRFEMTPVVCGYCAECMDVVVVRRNEFR